MDRRQGVDRLHLNDHRAFDQKIDAIADIDPNVVLGDRNTDLSLTPQSGLAERLCQTGFVDALKQTRLQGAMNREGGIQSPTADLFQGRGNRYNPLVSFVHPWCSW